MTITEIRPAKLATTPCPSWCIENHNPALDDGVHCSEILAIPASQHMRDDIDYPEEVLVNIQQTPDGPPLIHLTHHDGTLDSEDVLTPQEVEKLAWCLEKNASIIRANRGHTCWCDGMHEPDDPHSGQCESVSLSTSTLPYTPDVNVAIVREWDAPAAVVHLISHTETDWDVLTPDEAEKLAAHLRRCAATILTEGIGG